jgi:hypothetical protein
MFYLKGTMMFAVLMDFIDTIRLAHETKQLEDISSRHATQLALYKDCCNKESESGLCKNERSSLELHGDFADKAAKQQSDKLSLKRDLARDEAAKEAQTKKCDAIVARQERRKQQAERRRPIALRATTFL